MSAAADPNVSNGTCYSTENTEIKGEFIPCGNVALGHWPCCHAGDFCLSFDDANACWDADTGNTYLAGCTDPGFNDRACPWKSLEFKDQEWVAIQQCHKGTGNNDTQWGGCKISSDSTELEKLPHQSCDPYCSTYIYEGNTALAAFASLPNVTGESIAWTSGFEPTLVYAPITTAADVSGLTATTTSIQTRSTPASTVATRPASLTSTTVTTATPTPTASTQVDQGLTTGAKAGIGVGAAGAALLIIAIVLLALLMHRRKRRHQEVTYNQPLEQEQAGPPSPYHVYQAYQPSPQDPKPWSDGQAAASYAAGFKSELPANERPLTSELPADHSTMPRSYLNPQASPHSSTASPNSPYATFESTGTDQLSSYSDATTVQGGSSRRITPESTGSRAHGGVPLGRNKAPFDPASESHW